MKEYKINSDVMETFKKMLNETIDCCVTDCPYIVEAGGTRMVYLDENWESEKNDWSKTDPKWCLNRWKIVYVTDSSPTSQKWIKKDWSVPSAVKDWKMFEHNDISFSDWLPELYRVMKNWTHTYIMINSRNLCELQTEAEICWNTEEEKEKIRKGGASEKKVIHFSKSPRLEEMKLYSEQVLYAMSWIYTHAEEVTRKKYKWYVKYKHYRYSKYYLKKETSYRKTSWTI